MRNVLQRPRYFNTWSQLVMLFVEMMQSCWRKHITEGVESSKPYLTFGLLFDSCLW